MVRGLGMDKVPVFLSLKYAVCTIHTHDGYGYSLYFHGVVSVVGEKRVQM
jgi:hypothetical protein